eukprot:5655246-Amphidinium_carterae.1
MCTQTSGSMQRSGNSMWERPPPSIGWHALIPDRVMQSRIKRLMGSSRSHNTITLAFFKPVKNIF